MPSTGDTVPIVLLVDTGAGATFLDSGVAERLGLEIEGLVPTLGVGGKAQSSFVHVDSLRIGSVAVYDQSWMASDFSGIQEWFEHPPVVVAQLPVFFDGIVVHFERRQPRREHFVDAGPFVAAARAFENDSSQIER